MERRPTRRAEIRVYRRLLPLLAGVMFAGAGALILPSDAAAQESDGKLGTAGNEARFRVIDRFPERSEEKADEGFEYRVSDKLVGAIRRADWGGARKLLGREIGQDKVGRRFLDGYLAVKQQDWDRARDRFTSLVGEAGVPSDYAAFYAAKANVELGEHHQAVLSAAKVPARSRLYSDSLALMVRALEESGESSDRERARQVISVYLRHFPEGEHAREMHLRQAELLLTDKLYEKAAEHLFGLLRDHPLSEEADRAEELLEEHKASFSKRTRAEIDNPSSEVELAYFEALFDAHRSKDVISKLEKTVDEWTPGSRKRCQGLYWVAKSHTKLRKHGAAADWYDRILDECSGIPPYEKRALYLGGKSYWNSGDRPKALEHFETLWSAFDDHSYADDVMYFASRIYREMGKDADAEALLAEQVEKYPTGDMADNAHWLRVRSMIEDEQWQDVVDYVDGLESTGEDGANTRGRLAYFRGRALQELGEKSKAAEAYRTVADDHPLGYYALLSMNRLAELSDSSAAGPICSATDAGLCAKRRRTLDSKEETSYDFRVPQEVQQTTAYKKGVRLLSLGIRDWAESEFDRLFGRIGSEPGAMLGLADLLDRAGAHEVAYGLPARFDFWRKTYPNDNTRRAWTIAYPAVYRDEVEKWAKKRDLSDAFIWAIIRKESGYNPSIKSWANARGLMQLMPDTARAVARDEGMAGIGMADLLDPATNIRLGTAYLADLAEAFDQHPALVAAGYNGGQGNVSRWLRKRGDLPVDLWIEDIPYGQTRRYAKIVLSSYWTYRWLYGDTAAPRIDFNLPE